LNFQTNSFSIFPLSKEAQQSQHDFFVDTTQSATDDDITADQPEIAEDGEELIDYNEELEIEAERAKRKSLREQIAATGQGMRRMLVNQRAHQELFRLSSCDGGNVH
jgi:hypothetical protein